MWVYFAQFIYLASLTAWHAEQNRDLSDITSAMVQHGTNEGVLLGISKNQDSRLTLPGYGRPLDYAPLEKNIYGVESRSMFPSALDDRDIDNGYTESVQLEIINTPLTSYSLPVLTLREKAMVKIMEDITDIPMWWKRVGHSASSFMNQILNSIDLRTCNFRSVEKYGLAQRRRHHTKHGRLDHRGAEI